MLEGMYACACICTAEERLRHGILIPCSFTWDGLGLPAGSRGITQCFQLIHEFKYADVTAHVVWIPGLLSSHHTLTDAVWSLLYAVCSPWCTPSLIASPPTQSLLRTGCSVCTSCMHTLSSIISC